MQLKKANPDKEIELDSNTILRKAVMVSQNFNLKKNQVNLHGLRI